MPFPVLRSALAAVMIVVCSACAVGPSAPPLDAPVSTHWTVATTGLADEAPRQDWWRELGDPDLDALVAKVRSANHELAAAEARLRAARGLAQAARLESAPAGTAHAQAVSTRSSARAQPPFEGAPGRFPSQRLVEVGVDFQWELDLAGRLAHVGEAAYADAQATLWQRRQVEAAVAAATVLAWLERDEAGQAGALVERQLALLEGVRERLRAAIALGALRESELAPVELALASARQRQLSHVLSLRNAERRLATLAGRSSRAPSYGTAARGPVRSPERLPVGDPVTALRARPDVGIAEARVRAAFARAGVAAGEIYPRLTLASGIGLAAPASQLGAGGALQFASGPGLTWSLFDLPRLRAMATAAGAEADAAVQDFHATTLAALEEAEAAIDGWQTAVAVAEAARAAHLTAERNAELTAARHAAGLASALEEAYARADAAALESTALESAAQSRRAWAMALLALGAGWHATAP